MIYTQMNPLMSSALFINLRMRWSFHGIDLGLSQIHRLTQSSEVVPFYLTENGFFFYLEEQEMLAIFLFSFF